ncbi:hypothetical protein PLICRDRAFT_143402 [Plicaturopsis crispa FD-325 SS-3]|nr:hypothetical protein PLICRDRAFT_143402 [Plicaturopsis crispa FD-325 SS-3]
MSTDIDHSDKSKPYIPRSSAATDGWSKDGEATATCYCGAVQLAFPTERPALVDTFICHCTDCHKVSASMFATNFAVLDTHLKHLRGRENLTSYAQTHTIASGNVMTNHFCTTCGTLMYRTGQGFPGMTVMRLGTVDDFHLHETKLVPRVEQFTKDRVSWLHGAEGVQQVEGNAYA